MPNSGLVSNDQIQAIETFLYKEARYLDDGDLGNWMALYSDDATYWMPASASQTCPHTEISILYEDKLLMDIRRRNFGHALAPSMEYPVRGSRIIGNVQLGDTGSGNRHLMVTSNFHAQIYYREEMTSFAGRYRHELIHHADSFQIVKKRVDLINADGIQRNLLIYI